MQALYTNWAKRRSLPRERERPFTLERTTKGAWRFIESSLTASLSRIPSATYPIAPLFSASPVVCKYRGLARRERRRAEKERRIGFACAIAWKSLSLTSFFRQWFMSPWPRVLIHFARPCKRCGAQVRVLWTRLCIHVYLVIGDFLLYTLRQTFLFLLGKLEDVW